MSKKHKHNNRPNYQPQQGAPSSDLNEEVLEEQEELEVSEQEILCPPDCSEPKDDAERREEQPDAERHPEGSDSELEGSQGQEESLEEPAPDEPIQEAPVEELPAEQSEAEPQEEQPEEAPVEEASFEESLEEVEPQEELVEEPLQEEELPNEEPIEEQPEEEPLAEPTQVESSEEQTAEERQPEGSDSELEGAQGQDEPLAEAPLAEGELTDEQKAQAEAEAKAEKARKKAERAAKTREWFKKHVALVVSLSLVVLLAAGLCTGHFVMTRNVAFIHSADGLQKAIAKGKKTEYIFKNDVIWTGDLTLDGVNLDLNDHTLEVKGNLNLNGDGFVGYKKFVWSKPQVGGKVIVEGNLTMTGTRDLFSEFTVSGQVGGIDLNVYGDLSAASVVLSGNLDVEGKIDSTVTVGGNATVNGEVKSLNGGKEVVARGKIGLVTGADELYVYPESEVAAFSEVGNAYFVQYLEAPNVYLSKDANGNQMLVISHVRNADKYSIEISGIADADTINKSAGDNTQYVLPDLDPGDYTVTVKPISLNNKVYVTRDVTSVKVSYFVQLATPVFGIEASENAEGKLVVTVSIAPVEHAASFVVAVNGTERRVNAAHENVSLDVSDLITEVGTYNVTVYAVQPSGNYTNSEKALKSYVHTATAVIIATASKEEGGIRLQINCTSGQAYYYAVEWEEEGEAKSLTIRSQGAETEYLLEGLDVKSLTVRPLTKGYYEAGVALDVQVGAVQLNPDQGDTGEEENNNGNEENGEN